MPGTIDCWVGYCSSQKIDQTALARLDNQIMCSDRLEAAEVSLDAENGDPIQFDEEKILSDDNCRREIGSRIGWFQTRRMLEGKVSPM